MYPSPAASFYPTVTIATKVYAIVKGNDLTKRDVSNKVIYKKRIEMVVLQRLSG
jgi:hypothetical protein